MNLVFYFLIIYHCSLLLLYSSHLVSYFFSIRTFFYIFKIFSLLVNTKTGVQKTKFLQVILGGNQLKAACVRSTAENVESDW